MPTATFDYTQEAAKVKKALRAEFPQDTIATSEGYAGRVHVKVVSERFNGMSERDKQQYLWDLVQDHLGEDAQAVSLALAYSTDEL